MSKNSASNPVSGGGSGASKSNPPPANDDAPTVYQRVSYPPNKCICNRPKSMVVCTACGADGEKRLGRVATVCPIHPMTMYICDYVHCPTCKSPKEYLVEVVPKVTS